MMNKFNRFKKWLASLKPNHDNYECAICHRLFNRMYTQIEEYMYCSDCSSIRLPDTEPINKLCDIEQYRLRQIGPEELYAMHRAIEEEQIKLLELSPITARNIRAIRLTLSPEQIERLPTARLPMPRSSSVTPSRRLG